MARRLAVAALLDARDLVASRVLAPVQVIGFLASMVSTNTACRLRGHETRVIACPEVTRLCIRCGALDAE